MKLVGKSLAAYERPWANVDSVALRTRPGDRPAWLRLHADDEALGRLRSAAADARLPVDVVGALLVEWGVCESLLAELSVTTVLQWAELALTEPRLAPTEDLRVWDRLLAGHGPISSGDELPELCLPQRLAVRLPHPLSLTGLELARLPVATLCDRAACRLGMAMETWLLRQALGSVRDGGPSRAPAMRAQ
jgi:hypothetical protein